MFLVWITPKNGAFLCTIVVLRVLQITVSLFRQESNFIFNLLNSLRLLSWKQCVDVGTTRTIASKAPYVSHYVSHLCCCSMSSINSYAASILRHDDKDKRVVLANVMTICSCEEWTTESARNFTKQKKEQFVNDERAL